MVMAWQATSFDTENTSLSPLCSLTASSSSSPIVAAGLVGTGGACFVAHSQPSGIPVMKNF